MNSQNDNVVDKRMKQPHKLFWIASGMVLVLIPILVVAWHESPARIARTKTTVITYVSDWINPTICTQLMLESAELIKQESQKPLAQRQNESGLNWDIAGFPTLFGIELANSTSPILHRASWVYMRESHDVRWTESCFPTHASLGHRCVLLIVVSPAALLPTCYQYEVVFTNKDLGCVGIVLRER